MENEFVLIIDFGSQVTQLIARRLRELRVYCEIHPFNKVNDKFLKKFNPKAIILSGGPASVLNENAPTCLLSVRAQRNRKCRASCGLQCKRTTTH